MDAFSSPAPAQNSMPLRDAWQDLMAKTKKPADFRISGPFESFYVVCVYADAH